MTLKDIVLNEVNVEFGNGKALAVSDAVRPKISYDKTGSKAEPYVKTADLASTKEDTKASVSNIVNYLKSKNLWEKVSLKQNFNTTDLVFKADGSCVVNFDEGGSIKIPAAIVNGSQKVAPTIKDKFKKLIAASVITEGAYSNGRYEHSEGKKVNKYHPGHANPIYTKERSVNGKPETTRFGRTADDWANVSHFHPNPMGQRYADNIGYGKDGTGTNYRKGEIPNGYMIWSDKDERALKDAWESLIEIIKSSVKSEYYKKNPTDTFSRYSDGLYHFPKYAKPEYSPFSTKIQELRAKKALDKLNILQLRKNRIEKNNDKYDSSRSDRQIKKDARLWAKDKEHFDYVHNNGPKPVHTQSKEFRKKINGDVIRYEFESEKAAKKSKEKSDRINYIKQKAEENKKKRYSKEAWDKRRARQELREDVLEEDVKSKIVAFLKTKLVPYAITTGLIAGATAGSGALIKHSAKSIINAIKVLTANQEKVQAKVGNDTVSYDANKNILTVNGKSEKVKEEIKDEWWDNFPDDTNVEFGDEKIGSDNLNTLSNAKLNMDLIKPKAPAVSKMSVVTEGSHHSKYPPAINYKSVNNYLIKARKAIKAGDIEEAEKWAWEANLTMHEDEMQGPGVAADVNAYNVFHKQLSNIHKAIIAAKKSKGEI